MCVCTPSKRTPWCASCLPPQLKAKPPMPTKDEPAAAPAPNAALREIAGRLQRLSYSDMLTLARTLMATLPTGIVASSSVATALLEASDQLENA
jgi:hypothetical protein